MTETFKTEQEAFWAESFGDEYIDRNKSQKLLASNIAFFTDIFKRTSNIGSIMEFGANIGMNMRAINEILINVKLSAVEINKKACEQLKSHINGNLYNCSILDYCPKEQYDFVFTKGVLIHINPNELNSVYQKLYEASSKYICVAEFYNPSPMTISYRGHEDRLFKRDFAGEMLDKFSNLKLIDYGFVYRRDKNFAQDDITWFLMEKI
ncbi:MAG: pseudaminic acid biosynthesis-associated methylase [Phycisphaerae bacterium]|nr:pseudaminic acid biosynthesis-associated methylase [Phycisphaerae bacterium]